ncbi:hypothetical protein [Sphingomonas hengshuiensis]|nr:hypothetical protein [Sphingomonas hengshuiensis]
MNQNISPLSIATAMSGGVSVELVGDPANPVTTQMGVTMRMANMPDFSLDDIFRLMRRRIRMPVNLHFGLSIFPFNLYGVDVVQFSICGEPQVILDDYVPNAYERCAVECEPCET